MKHIILLLVLLCYEKAIAESVISGKVKEAITSHVASLPDVCVTVSDDISGRYIGMYYKALRLIEVKRGYENQAYPHELGHAIWFSKSEAFRNRFIKLRGSNPKWYPSEYAKTNLLEDFAECFHAYILDIPMPVDVRLFFETNLNNDENEQ